MWEEKNLETTDFLFFPKLAISILPTNFLSQHLIIVINAYRVLDLYEALF